MEPWRSDGTEAGTVLVADIEAGSGASNPFEPIAFKGRVYFAASSAATGYELWRTTAPGTGVELFAEGIPGPEANGPGDFGVSGSTLYFANGDTTAGYEPWKTNGSAGGTGRFANLNPDGGGYVGQGYEITAVGGLVYFTASRSDTSTEPWVTDGTPGGTVFLRDIEPGAVQSNPRSFSFLGGTTFFVASNAEVGVALWQTDGTPANTVPFVAFVGYSPAQGLTLVGDLLFFTTDYAGNELFVTDGTPEGTGMVKDINPSGGNAYPSQLFDFGGTLLFSANDGTSGYELWKSDGTEGGTMMVKEFYPGGNSGAPQGFATVGATAVFMAEDETNGRELWRTDGTGAGTSLVKDIRPGIESGSPIFAVSAGSLAFFIADDGTTGSELWKTDGTGPGTSLVKDIVPGAGSPGITSFVPVGDGSVMFAATDDAGGTELWRSDGSSAGTVRVKDIVPGPQGSGPSGIRAIPGTGRVVFSAYDPVHGVEVWTSDGTGDGTRLVADLEPGPGSSGPRWFALAGTTPAESYVILSAFTTGGSWGIWSIPFWALGASASVLDADDDGFSDELETAAGSDPGNATSTPLSAPAGDLDPLTVTKKSVKLVFNATGKDTASLSGTIPVPGGFEPEGATVLADVGGVVRTFTLDAKGKSTPRDPTSFSVKLKVTGGVAVANPAAKFTLKLGKGDYDASFADEGLSGDATVKKSPRTMRVTLVFAGTGYQADLDLLYIAKAGVSGKAR